MKILEICIDGASKTNIVYQANLNFHTVVPYLDLLIKKEMIECKINKLTTYKTTPKGLLLFEELKTIQGKIPEIYNLKSSERNLAMP